MLTKKTFLPWVPVPTTGLVDVLKEMRWQRQGSTSAAQDVAALMVYVVLLFIRQKQVADITYDQLQHATGLSRSLICQGLKRLESVELILCSGSKQKRQYVFPSPPADSRWFKLPCRAVMTDDGVVAFKTFTLRSKHELNALKMYLYLANVRDRKTLYTEASYETIYKRLAIPERDIRRAINVLNTSGLLARVNRESDPENSSWGPNKYFLKGYADIGRPAPNAAE